MKPLNANDTNPFDILDKFFEFGLNGADKARNFLNPVFQQGDAFETVPQIKLWVAQCYAQIGDTQNATKTYQDIIKNHPKSEQAKQAQAALQKQTTSEVDTTTIKE